MALKRGDRGTIAGFEVVVTDVDATGAATVTLTGQPFLREALPPIIDEPRSLDDFQQRHAGHGITAKRPDREFKFVDYSCAECGEDVTYRVYDVDDVDEEDPN